MSRKCKPGQRARVIDGGVNEGKIVLVVRHQLRPDFEGSRWPDAVLPWVVAAIGSPLEFTRTVNGEDPRRMQHWTAIYCDTGLEPLQDDDDGLRYSTGTERPKSAHKAAKRPARPVSAPA